MMKLFTWVCLLGTASAAAGLAREAATEPPRVEAPPVTASIAAAQGGTLLAHWKFDEPAGKNYSDGSGNGCDATLEAPASAVPPGRGIHERALTLQGAHALRTRLGHVASELSEVTFSVWVRPMDLSGFRELFRQECANRVLFSFQESGSVLSLGLNIGGYVECDAPIHPPEVLDGMWHHCAATFDGEWMRVYLDGREVGGLHRPGRISLSPEAPAYIGSSGGYGEHFQGQMDDLRIYRVASKPGEVLRLHEDGKAALSAFADEMNKLVQPIYPAGKPFAETLASVRRELTRLERGLAPDVAFAVQSRLRTDFPAECGLFANWTGIQPLEYLTHAEAGFDARLTGRLIELLFEYQPLTERQRKNQTQEAAAKWEAFGKLRERYHHLVAQGDAAQFSPEWIKLIMEAGPHIDFRPAVHEPVAPYRRPETPETRMLSTAEARHQLETDWLHQVDQQPTPERIQEEIRWARELAARISAASDGKMDFTEELTELARLAPRTGALESENREVYFRVRELKRVIMFRNPVLDFNKLLFVDMPYPQGSEWQHETRHRLGYMAVPGARLLVLEGLRPDGRVTRLMPQAPLHGSFWRPDLSWDGSKVLLCFKPHNEKSFHIYEMNVDGSGLTQLTDGPFDDLDPIYLPDERHIVFSTTRGHTYVRCMPPTSAFVLARCERDGRNLYLISANNEPDYLPSVMHDGRVIYTRWEYTDKPLWRAQKLWTINPDGTQVLMYWGNQSVWPDLMKDARHIPGSRRVMFTGSAHHNWFAGSVGIVDPDEGFNFPWGLTKVTADVVWPECGNGPVDPVESADYHSSGKYDGYYSPYPLSEQDFIVSASRAGKFLLYLMDVAGNRELIYEGAHNIFHALPLKPRLKPPVIPDRVDWPSLADRERPKEGLVFSSSVYQGAPDELRGKAKFLRVFSIDAKTYTYWYQRPYISTGPVVSAVQSEGVKRLLGNVPIEEDGSVSFAAPAGIPLHFQLLDEQQRALHTMRSFVSLMPGEQRGCLGCHESHSRTADPGSSGFALLRTPSQITPPPWPDQTVSFPRYVQPVLDKYCGQCHQGDGEGRKTLDLTMRPSAPVFPEPYLTLIGRPSWGSPYHAPEQPAPGFGIAGMMMVEAYDTVDPRAYVTPQPMTSLSYQSKLIDLVSSGKHHEVKVDEISRLRLIAWVDAMCPYLGDEEVREIPDPTFQGVDWLAVRPKIATAPRITRPGPMD